MHRFERGGNKLSTCRGCGAACHSDVRGSIDLSLCIRCYEEAGMENEHSDGHHEDAPDPECAACRQEAAERRECSAKPAKPAKPGPGRLVRVREEDPTYDSWPTWDHPLGGWGRWAVVIRSLRSGVEAAPIVQGYTLPPRGLRAWLTLEDHRIEAHGRYENAVRSHKIACSSGLYTPTQLGEPPVYPAWLARALPEPIHARGDR